MERDPFVLFRRKAPAFPSLSSRQICKQWLKEAHLCLGWKTAEETPNPLVASALSEAGSIPKSGSRIQDNEKKFRGQREGLPSTPSRVKGKANCGTFHQQRSDGQSLYPDVRIGSEKGSTVSGQALQTAWAGRCLKEPTKCP